MATTRQEIRFPKLHPSQRAVAEDAARFRVMAAGRRWGKSRLGSALCVAEGLQGRRAWWIAPSYKVANVGWRMIRRLAYNVPGVEIRQVDRAVLFTSGGEVSVRSADNPDSLRGEGLDFAVLDECAFMKEDAWTHALRPALSDRRGRAMFISTPTGRNWFWRLWQRGLDGGDEWHSWQLPTSDNPYIDPAEIEAARDSMPVDVYRQEYEAAFLEGEGAVFRNIAACIAQAPAAADPNRRYVMGVDWAQITDYTVFVVMDAVARQVVSVDRFNHIGWDVQRDRLAALAERWHVAEIWAEHNAIGGPNIEQLQNMGLPVKGYQMTQQSKQDLVWALQSAFEREEIRIPDHRVMIGELEAFEAVRLLSGKWRYQAPEGMHDDTVIALAIAYEAANRPPGVRISRGSRLYGSRQRSNISGLYGSRR